MLGVQYFLQSNRGVCGLGFLVLTGENIHGHCCRSLVNLIRDSTYGFEPFSVVSISFIMEDHDTCSLLNPEGGESVGITNPNPLPMYGFEPTRS